MWAAVLIALLSGGGAVWLTSWNERHKRFRDRLIAAADDFSVAASDALIALRAARDKFSEDPDAAEDEIRGCWAARAVMCTRSARIDLLFAPGSKTGQAASAIIHDIARGHGALRAANAAWAEVAVGNGAEHLREFQRDAFEGNRVAAPPSATIRESTRRALGRKAKVSS